MSFNYMMRTADTVICTIKPLAAIIWRPFSIIIENPINYTGNAFDYISIVRFDYLSIYEK